ncbi:outer membrane protein [Rubellimicrobium sp. CFH 75288]|uniref:outer membrane protein n=1 Tax=Rubellimicrobium sp. CFH 75288 TaxID=2697034 RepID=UPI0014127C1D|nr:outer membrane beta-barrel protein [Rubellimicrobium sp. CFH 75288]NAZ35639.1 outer membrane beta-barrel protein [Rubellimicrobium sp. CFH 75288]
MTATLSPFRSLRAGAALLLALSAAPAWAEVEIGLYGGWQTAPHSGVTIRGDDAIPDADFTAGWEGRSFEMPPHWGLRATWWPEGGNLGWGVELNHAKVYADRETLDRAGLEHFEFSDGLNLVTVNGFYRWPEALGPLTPYAGAGIGLAVPHVEVVSGDSRTWGYQVTGPAVTWMAGASYALTDRWSVFGEYKGSYSMNSADLAGGGTLETDIVTNSINFGVSFSF